jgi:hypothetical protein
VRRKRDEQEEGGGDDGKYQKKMSSDINTRTHLIKINDP